MNAPLFCRLATTLAILVASASLSLAEDPPAAESQSQKAAGSNNGGFQELFDGESLASPWKHSGNWHVEEGAITRKGKGGSLVWSGEKIPDDFELQFEWKIAKGSNSGVYYRPGQYEYQILDNKEHGDGSNPRTSAASLYFCIAPAKDVTAPVGEWNKARIVCKGTVIQHWLNGEKVIDFDYEAAENANFVALLKQRGGDISARGAYLNLQDHGDPVWYRAFRLRTIPAAEDIKHSPVTPAAIPEAALQKEQLILDRIRQNREATRRAAGVK